MILKSIIKKKKIIYVVGDNRSEVSHFIEFVLKNNFSVCHLYQLPTSKDIISLIRSSVVVIEDDEKSDVCIIKDFLMGFSCIFTITESKKKKRIKKYLNNFGKNWDMVLDFSIARKLKKKRGKQFLTFAVNKKQADFNATDIHQQEDKTNFKISYAGSIIPFWIEKKLNKKEVYFLLSAICVAQMMKLNLAEVSYMIKKKWPVISKK